MIFLQPLNRTANPLYKLIFSYTYTMLKVYNFRKMFSFKNLHKSIGKIITTRRACFARPTQNKKFESSTRKQIL